MAGFKKPIFWLLSTNIIGIIIIIQLIIKNIYIFAFFLAISLIMLSKHMINLGIRLYTGDFNFNVDLSLVNKKWIKIFTKSQNTNKDNCIFYHSAIYTKKESELGDKKPYVILAHGMGGSLEDLEIIAVPLALTGYKVVSFNQTGHGLGIHKSPGNGKNYVNVMTNIHDIVDYVLNQDDLEFDLNGKPKIAFIGASTGGLMALTQAYLNESIKVIVALSGIHDFRDILAKEKDMPRFSNSRLFLWMLRRMKVKVDYNEEENKIISPKQTLTNKPENSSRVFMVHCENDPLPIEEAYKNQKSAGIPEENTLFLSKGGHAFRAQETILTAVIGKWLSENL